VEGLFFAVGFGGGFRYEPDPTNKKQALKTKPVLLTHGVDSFLLKVFLTKLIFPEGGGFIQIFYQIWSTQN